MSLKAHHGAVFLFIGSIALVSLAWLGLPSGAVATCSSGANVAIIAPIANATMSGSQTLKATTSGATMPADVTFMITAPNQIVLGDTGPSGSTNSDWSLSWDSRSVPDGGYQISAVAHYGSNSTYDCLSAPVPVNVINSQAPGTQAPTLSATISPGSWEGVPGQTRQFSVTGVYTDQLGVQHPISASSGATFKWSTNGGVLAGNGTPVVTLTDAPTVGSYNLGVIITMNGLTVEKSVPVGIVATSSGSSPGGPTPSSAPSTTTTTVSGNNTPITTSLTPQQAATLATMPTIFRPQNPTNSDPVVPVQTLGCLAEKLGANFNKIASGQQPASTDDRLKGSGCFSGSAKIPASLAPVTPTIVSDLPASTDIVSVTGLKNETITNKSGQKITAILLNGTGVPNTNIFLYIFSDPMVLRAQTDSAGKWSYVLENPLKPGHHEIYAVSQKDASTFVRTPAVPVAIAAASSGSQDGSLIIEHSLQPAQVTFVAAAVVMVALGLLLLIQLRRRPRPGAIVPAADQPLLASTPPTTPTPNEHHDPQT
ncbi:MAG TPA: hypothetical protein VGH44_06115 [Candidatus Saccharimonadia bacterium]|jgi:hypothetical protein